jgi:ectoine hydroxylase
VTQTSAVTAAPTQPMTAEQRARFERNGYLIIRGALRADEVAAVRDALDRVYATAAKAGSLGQMPFRFEWHQDGGRQNREIETTPRPRLSVKLAYWLSDVSQPGRGNLKVVPGSHVVNWIDGPPRRDVEWPDPDGAIEVIAEPGDATFFDRRIWHARSLGGIEPGNGDHAWGHNPATTPLYGWLAERGLLDPANAPLKP